MWCKGKLLLRKQPNVLDCKHFSAGEDHSSSSVPQGPVFPYVCKNTTQGRQKLSQGKSLSQRRKEVLSIEKLVLELRWGNIFPGKGDREEKSHFHGPLLSQLCFLFHQLLQSTACTLSHHSAALQLFFLPHFSILFSISLIVNLSLLLSSPSMCKNS